ncbi:MAG TPA: ribosomal RNA small subunit methyltransferase A [Verrucomicrobiales bacterium]|nr:ribosomal RNA small subunit methyltransferase A [Verrucomicrobiales bacterium]HIL72328.1 ribosomal RNA small subunit methyltransferase A [Verrucomicrobiota bacterium]
MNLSDMKSLLTEEAIQLTKSLGQNFLHDGNQLERIIRASCLRATDRVLEIGPGLGPLTERLLDNSKEVLAIEKDRRLADILEKRFGERPEFKLEIQDALAFLKRGDQGLSPWKLISNLPYSVASRILVEATHEYVRGPERIVVTMQKEVVDRILCDPGKRQYGVITLLLRLNYEPLESFQIPRTCFHPIPDVDSCCVVLEKRKTPLLPSHRAPDFYRLVKISFGQRRKKLVNNLKPHWDMEIVKKALQDCGISDQLRGEKLSLTEFIDLTNALSPDV